MVAAVEDDVDIRALKNGFSQSLKDMKPYREKRIEFLREITGIHYGNQRIDSEKVPINLLNLSFSIKNRQLAPRRPRAQILTDRKMLKPLAAEMELALNKTIKQIKLGASIAEAVQEAMIAIGILKIGLDISGEYVDDDEPLYTGQVFVDPVSVNDFVFDTTAKRLALASFMGSRMHVQKSVLENNPFYDQEVVAKILPLEGNRTYEDESDNDNLGMGDKHGSDDTFGKLYEIWEFFLPYDQKVVTIASSGEPNKLMSQPLSVREWTGAPNGPYRFLTFMNVPGNALPLPPVAIVYDIHTATNHIARKTIREAESRKKVYGIRGGSASGEDVHRIKGATDGEAVQMDSMNEPQEMVFGGVDQMSVSFIQIMKQLYSYMDGNLDIQGGLSAMSDTLGQDQLLAGSASKLIEDMQDRVMEFVTDVMGDICHYIKSDPIEEISITKRLPGSEYMYETAFNPDNLPNDGGEFDIEIEPYSAVNQSPASRLQTLSTIYTNFIMPNMQYLAQQGAIIDFPAFLKIIAKYADIKEITDIIQFTAPPGMFEGQPQMGSARGPTHSVYERRNTSKKDPMQKEAEMAERMMAGASGGRE